ncbi:CBS domain-containing protein [Streptomyces collinus]|uniref:CBS domain-containing protein n=1 Tax=Streptomyces collinus TaxID=42684 RepID=UPI0036EC4218
MHHRRFEELMTRDVVRARRDTPFKELVRLLGEHVVTAVPAVDDLDRPVGVVSEADLLRKSADQADPLGRVPLPHLEAWERAKAAGARAEELMSAPAVCARPERTVAEAARLMETRGVKRLPVVHEADRLLGVVSRGDLLRIFLRRDEAIREEITGDLLRDGGQAPPHRGRGLNHHSGAEPPPPQARRTPTGVPHCRPHADGRPDHPDRPATLARGD